MTRINGWACFLLVSLRLVIGWHFLVEGMHKIHTHREGSTSTNTPWSGEAFFREGYGPAAPLARSLLELSTNDAIGRITVVDNQFPKSLADEWQRMCAAFEAHFELTAEQKKQTGEKLEAAFKSTLAWLNGESKSEIKKTMLWGQAEFQKSVPERLAEYQAKLAEIQDSLARRMPTFNQDVEHSNPRAMKADAARMLADLNADLNSRAEALKADLRSVLTDGQKSKGPAPDSVVRRRIDVLDQITMYSLAGLGALLVFGLFSRTASLMLATFLLSVQLIAPAVPYAPTPPGALGHYLYVNLYTIEMVALLVLSAMPTGRWFGLDALSRRARKPSPGDAPRMASTIKPRGLTTHGT